MANEKTENSELAEEAVEFICSTLNKAKSGGGFVSLREYH